MRPCTVIIAAYNAEATIARAVESARACEGVTRTIVVDDGSQDATPERAARAGADVLQRPNAGPGAARNTAINHCAEGPVAFLDADDEALPGLADALTLAHDAQVACVISGHIAVDARGSERLREPDPAWLPERKLPCRGLALGTSHIMCTSGLVLAPHAARLLRFREDLRFGEDRDLIYRAGALGVLAVTSGPVIRKHAAGGMTADPRRAARWLADQLHVVRLHCPPERGGELAMQPLRQCAAWVVRHAARCGAVDRELWAQTRDVFAERGWLDLSTRRAWAWSRLRASLAAMGFG